MSDLFFEVSNPNLRSLRCLLHALFASERDVRLRTNLVYNTEILIGWVNQNSIVGIGIDSTCK